MTFVSSVTFRCIDYICAHAGTYMETAQTYTKDKLFYVNICTISSGFAIDIWRCVSFGDDVHTQLYLNKQTTERSEVFSLYVVK